MRSSYITINWLEELALRSLLDLEGPFIYSYVGAFLGNVGKIGCAFMNVTLEFEELPCE